ncbi:MAG: hypothetical protein JWO80_1425 [Bryobacterales bacterium]|nr:hypothetical protein [Bryobacterales bacterium]
MWRPPGLPLLLIAVLIQVSCVNDPFDPVMGGRNARPGAERYLRTRMDISVMEKRALLDYRACSISVLRGLAQAPSREVRSLVAVNPAVDEDILEELSLDKDPAVRQYVCVKS